MSEVPARSAGCRAACGNIRNACPDELTAFPLNSVEVLGYRGERVVNSCLIHLVAHTNVASQVSLPTKLKTLQGTPARPTICPYTVMVIIKGGSSLVCAAFQCC